MSDAFQTQVLIAGAGPIGMTAGIVLARRGVACRVVEPLVEPLVEPPQYAKAVGVQHRTLEVFDVAAFERAAAAAVSAVHGRMDVYLIAAPGADGAATALPVVHDSDGGFARAYTPAYTPSGPSAYVVRPDGYLSLAGARIDAAELVTQLCATFARPEGGVAG
jgi:hypothetical protein